MITEQCLQSLTLADLVQHIISSHHSYLREALPTLSRQLEQLEAVHPELKPTREVFRGFALEMQQHMEKEEKVLFPQICSAAGEVSAEWMTQVVAVMEADHESLDKDLATIRSLTHDYRVPPDASPIYQEVMQGLAALEADTHRHVHAENDVLFPKSIAHAHG